MATEKTMLEQIIEYCDNNGLTSYELAKHLPLSQVALHGILTGTTAVPRKKNVQLIYDYLFGDNTVKEISTPYVTPGKGFDEKIKEVESKIKEIQDQIDEIESNEPDSNLLKLLHERIALHHKEINLILAAKIDKLSDK